VYVGTGYQKACLGFFSINELNKKTVVMKEFKGLISLYLQNMYLKGQFQPVIQKVNCYKTSNYSCSSNKIQDITIYKKSHMPLIFKK